MEKNITRTKLFPSLEELNEEFIQQTVELFRDYTDIELYSKILHYLKKTSFYYYCNVYKKTKSNPFNVNINFCFEFIDGEIPYVTILTDFIEPTLNDNRNYYKCLTKEHKYIFYSDNTKEHQIILESMINGIGNFLNLLKDSRAINTFIFFGEYEYNHIYQINDFLMNKNYLNFYRINLINDNKEEERYILYTKLYFLLFEPLKEDKALIKVIYQEKLKDMNLDFDKNEPKNSLLVKIPLDDNKEYIEFIPIDRSINIIKKRNRISRNKNGNNFEQKKGTKENEIKGERSKSEIIKETENKENEIKGERSKSDTIKENISKENETKEERSKSDIIKESESKENETKGERTESDIKEIENKENEIKEESSKSDIIKESESKENETKGERTKSEIIRETESKKKENKDQNTKDDNEIKENNKDKKFDYSILLQEWFTYKDLLNFNKYELVINKYDMLFNEDRQSLKVKENETSKIEEYNNLIEFYEKLINYYQKKKIKNKEKIHKIISNIIFICSELVNFAKNKNKKDNEYLLKVKKYLDSYK